MTDLQSAALLTEVRALLQSARALAARQVNALQVLTNFEIGRRIVEHEQGGEERAEYGRAVVKALSMALTAEFGRGFSVESLWTMRRFFMTYQGRHPKLQTLSTVSSTPSLAAPQLPSPLSQATPPFTLSWSHYVLLLAIDDPNERSFYEIEATRAGWSLRELRRQFDSSLYERLALSRDKDGVMALAAQGQQVTSPADLLKDPFVLEFLGLEERTQYSESDLETGLLGKLEQFMLELGQP